MASTTTEVTYFYKVVHLHRYEWTYWTNLAVVFAQKIAFWFNVVSTNPWLSQLLATSFISSARLYGRWSTAEPAGEPLMSLCGISWLINVITIEQPLPRAADLPSLSVTFSCWSSDYIVPVYSSRTIGRNEQINLLSLCRIPRAD